MRAITPGDRQRPEPRPGRGRRLARRARAAVDLGLEALTSRVLRSRLQKVLRPLPRLVLTLEARLFLRRNRPRVVVVTGSVGKTSAKDMVASVLAERYRVRASYQNYNWDVFVPLAILRLPYGRENPVLWLSNIVRGLVRAVAREPLDWLVVEVATARPGDVARTSRWLRADVVVFTRFAEVPAHVGRFGSRERVLEDKGRLLDTLGPGGVVVVNSDDEDFGRLVEARAAGRRVVRYGTRPPADILGTGAEIVYEAGRPVGMIFSVRSGPEAFRVRTGGVVGDHFLYAVLAATAAASVTGLGADTVRRALTGWRPQAGRMRPLGGIRGALIVDDSYNASPAAARQALTVLQALKTGGRRVAVLGDMLELGDFAPEEHARLGRLAASVADLLVAVGAFADVQALAAEEAGMPTDRIVRFADSRRAAEAIAALVEPGDLVLVKGSQGSRMERVVERLLARPEDRTLLTRQEPEWQRP